MQNNRVDANPDDEDQYPFPRLKPGEYGKDVDGIWYCQPPNYRGIGCLGDGSGAKGHKVIEHEDGSITVSPSILISGHDGSYHGFLERGVWRDA